jgi:cytochrome P450
MTEPFIDATFDDSLHAMLRQARSVSPTAISAESGAVVALGYGEVERLAHDPRLAGVGLTFFDFMGVPDGPLRRWYGSLMFTNEGPDHHRLRRLVARSFTPRAVERLRELAAASTAQRLRELVADGGGDLVAAFADLPISVICRLLGVPDDRVADFIRFGDDLSPVFGFMDPLQIVAADAAIVALQAAVEEMIDAHEARGDDLISALLGHDHDHHLNDHHLNDNGNGNECLSREEVVTIVGNLIVGGHDTTASQVGCSLLTLLRNPSAAAALRDGQVTKAQLANETIRYEPSISIVPRTATEAVEVGGIERPAGTMVFLSTASANRQAAVWGDPDVLRPQRWADPSVPKLLSFGSGAHYCLGAALARMTLEEVVDGWSATGEQLSPAFAAGEVAWRNVLGRSPVSLCVTA